MIEIVVAVGPHPLRAVRLAFASVEDFERVVDRCRAATWQLGGVLEQGQHRWTIGRLDTFGARACLAWFDGPASGLPLVEGSATLWIAS